jgi:hypothetical protein
VALRLANSYRPFPNASCAFALIHRLTHYAVIIPIEGESYRKREAELSQKRRGTA